MNAISSGQPQIIDFAGRMARSAALASPGAKLSAPRNPDRFNDALEAALTGIVITGVLLSVAGLLRDAMPVCTARLISNDLLILAAIVSGAVSLLFVGRHLIAK